MEEQDNLVSTQQSLENSLAIPLGVVNYADLKQLIFKSFIQLYSIYNSNIPIIFKTLNDNEILHIKKLAGNPQNGQYEERLNIYYFLYSLYSIDGVNLLKYRDAYYKEVLPFIKTLHPKVFHNILLQLFQLSERANEAVKIVERYTFEHDSRWLWVTLNHLPLTSTHVTGIEGSEYLGYNICQLLWTFYNKREDEKTVFDQQWSCAKLITSAINPKGIQKLNQQEDSRKEEEKQRREALVLGKGYKPKFKIHSREELVEELEKQMTGDKDQHDKIIDSYLKRSKYQKIKEEETIKEQREQLSAKGINPLFDFDPAQLEEQFEAKRQNEKQIYENLRKQKDGLYSEHVKNANLHVDAQKLSPEEIAQFEKQRSSAINTLAKNKDFIKNLVPSSVYEKMVNQHTQIEQFQGGQSSTEKINQKEELPPIDPTVYLNHQFNKGKKN